MSQLSSDTEAVIKAMFNVGDQPLVYSLLEIDCGAEVLGCVGWTPKQMERIRFAVLKLGRGDLDSLEKAIRLAKTDYRDLLMHAGFGEDLKAHEKWRGSIIGR